MTPTSTVAAAGAALAAAAGGAPGATPSPPGATPLGAAGAVLAPAPPQATPRASSPSSAPRVSQPCAVYRMEPLLVRPPSCVVSALLQHARHSHGGRLAGPRREREVREVRAPGRASGD